MNEVDKILKTLDKFRFKVDRSMLLSDIFTITACAISNQVDTRHFDKREKEYKDIMSKYAPEDQGVITEVFGEIFHMCSDCAITGVFNDWLGELYMKSLTSSKNAGQFFTPFNVSKLTAAPLIKQATENFMKNSEVITIDEPACGSGGLILALLEGLKKEGMNYAENCFVHASDLDGRCVKMCYIQLSLAGVPAIIHHRDTLRMETFDVWYTPAYCFNYLKFRKYEGDNL